MTTWFSGLKNLLDEVDKTAMQTFIVEEEELQQQKEEEGVLTVNTGFTLTQNWPAEETCYSDLPKKS